MNETSEAKVQYETALDMARRGREAWLEDPSKSNFLVWRDASDTAIKWHRAIRLSQEGESSTDDELEAILAG